MEQCLYVPEVIRVICEHLAGDSTLSTALACRAFLEPGLNQRWRCITSFEPLIACLPADLWRFEEDGSSTTLFLRRSVTPDDLHRYRTFYARRIRSVELLYFGMKRVFSSEALQGLQIATDWEFGALCPLVTSIAWYTPPYPPQKDATKHVFPFLSILLGQNIHSLYFTVSSNDPLHYPYLRSVLSRLNGGLKSLDLLTTVTPHTPNNALSLDKHITSFTWDRLEYLSVAYISEVAIAHLAQLPCLATLQIESLISHLATTPPASGRESDHSSSSYGFSSLRSVTIDAPVLADIASFFRYLRPENQIKEVYIAADICTSTSDFQSIIDTIQHQCQPTTLESLTIRIQGQSDEIFDPVFHPEPDISPLFAFSQLKILNLCVDGGVSLTPDVVERIPVAFPNIKELELSSLYPNSKIPRIDHIHFLALLRRCRFLESVRLQFDASHISDRDGQPSVSITGGQAPLVHLDVIYSPIRSPTLVANFLRAHFPRLRSVGFFEEDRDNGYSEEEVPLVEKRWAAVDKSLRQG